MEQATGPFLMMAALAGVSAFTIWRVRALKLPARVFLMVACLCFLAAGLAAVLTILAGRPAALDQVALYMQLVAMVPGATLLVIATYAAFVKPLEEKWITGIVGGSVALYLFFLFTGAVPYATFYFAAAMIALTGVALTNLDSIGKPGMLLLGAGFVGMLGAGPASGPLFYLSGAILVGLIGQAMVQRAADPEFTPSD